MSDMTRHGRRAFWTLAAAVVVLAGTPSLLLVEAARDYWRFITGWDPGVLHPTTVRRLPAHDGGEIPDIRFVEFALVAPAAKTVGLAASFNGFDAGALPLSQEEDGSWKTVVPLPPGSYEYAFEVDGRSEIDPAAGAPLVRAGRTVSVRRVQ